MIRRSLLDIQTMAGGSGLSAEKENEFIHGITTDSRKIEARTLFIPIVGENFDGHEFAGKALEEGAAATLWDRNKPNPPSGAVILVDDTLKALQQLASSYLEQLQLKVIGVTGSNGKTTTKDMVASLLSTTYRVHKTKGNFNNHIGLPLTILSMKEDTEVAVLEMGMSGRGEIELLSNLAKPDAAIITNIGESHLMNLGSREGIAEAKLEIVSGLKPDGVLIYDGEEPLLTERVQAYSYKTISFGGSERNAYSPSEIQQTENGTFFKISGREEKLFLPVLGKHNVNNALAAIAAAEFLGVPQEKISEGLKTIQMTGMRLELTKTKENLAVINDAYNASPTSMKAAIRLACDMQGYNQKILVLGDILELGDEMQVKFHQEVGESIDSKEIHHLFTFGKLGAEIAAGARKKMDPALIHVYQDKQELINQLKQTAKSGDLVLVKASRGMKLEEVVHALL
ncbi:MULTISPECIES: UDP-N-acetylmuramoyl-tripeptide--D-alanyl-D-alanine ligase [Metabacillus]|uniref:UDP-N-acetylmuramoyl-tripeptide--D-alanyl-D-alanine ligase n=1 Tax=Metabacillus hrfriensis TaxID=3048891 RepID=A0ACD4RC49_9BACI|nr:MULTISPECIES: UDP-N-acetylmuramoyl-tripeptide--D-alanyl-D-alanine ligase [Metabacillus]UAL52536.1 UDP-N-acetylmuramoyl-tripeptide--D-alanyl-D-alanine ligase [Metabacillus dongyingensis]WHZ58063.1 UDP-N-acetylmuramoyl-tripeptide--D-alanyl-D-alanine ligase [Metabacillus sp. CT-WN-B3]